MKIALYLSVILMMAGCASGPVKEPVKSKINRVTRLSPNLENFKKFDKMGNADVKVQAYLTTRGGELRYPSQSITLVPRTPYTEQFFNIMIFESKGEWAILDAPADPRILPFVKAKRPNNQGVVTFTDIPEGEYYVYSMVNWSTDGYFMDAGNWLWEKINIGPEEKDIEIVLSNSGRSSVQIEFIREEIRKFGGFNPYAK